MSVMNRQLFLSIVTVLGLLSACSRGPVNPPSTTALGDSPTLTGTISNLSDAGVQGTSLQVKAEINVESGTKTIAEGRVTANSVFTIKLPGLATIENDLYETNPAGGCADNTLNVTPPTYRAQTVRLVLYSNGRRVDQIHQANGPLVGGQREAWYFFSDRDVGIEGPCDTGLGVLNYDVEMKQGWNILILGRFPDETRFGFRTALPDASYKWLIPVCTVGCPN